MEMMRKIFIQLFGYSSKEWATGGIVAAIGGVIAGMLGGYDTLIKALLFAMASDVGTGFYLSKVLKQTSSSKGISGIHKKIGILMMIAFATIIDGVLGQTGVLRNGAVIFYLAMEGLSLVENLTAMGVPAFQPLKEYLVQLKEGSKKGPSKIVEVEAKEEVK
ncbi:phage holin family protein [Proteiniclasticum sp. SCR006]|uniref:Phage holin family protein n=1 Tax=Proteiniclasticum aestuarii TaxID=2817862 RepID=A0A939H577_9CLOT|nr:phage holin family protein [Proteiniclasticum aestuarii]MBO1264384.1 phage holin family protein [Proteiniclasticum aestuarii]